MATNEIERSYIDNYAVKEFIKDTLVPKYFPDIDISLRTVGTIGLVSELMSNISEDSFNASSVLFREAFPNRAEIPESIYSHASIFQLSNIFSSASKCSFLIVLEEESIINNMTYDPTSSMYYFYLDKNTTVYVENVPYVLDYDIRIRCVKKKTTNSEQYIFTASYVLSDFTNSISEIQDPYIKIRRSNNGYLALEVTMHQVTREIQYESIVTNSKINMPYIDIEFDGQLAGFDIMYKTPEESEYTTQMQTLLVYSHPITKPFCYYQLYNDNTLRLSFNARDSYFTPKFNSELKIILYLSKGKEANFDVYNGSNITIETANAEHVYDQSIVIAAKTLSGSTGGADRLGLDALQALTIESYRTAQALTTEADLTTFFSNYKYTYGDFYIKFIKRRNDVFERIFGGYCMIQYESEIFKTNTLDIHMNLSDMDSHYEDNIYMIEPGTVFTYSNDTDNHITFYRDPVKYDQYYSEYLQAIDDGTIPFIENADDTVPEYLRNRNASYAEFKVRKGYDDKVHIFDMPKEELSLLTDYKDEKFLFINPFLMRFKKSPNIVSLYQTYISDKSTVDFINQNDNTLVQFVAYQLKINRTFDSDKEYTVTTSIMPSITLDNKNSIIAEIGVDENGDPIYNLNNRYTLDQNDVRVLFVIYNGDNPICYSEMYPTSFTDNTTITYETKFDSTDYITSNNKLRLKPDVTYLVLDADSIMDAFPEIETIHNNWYFKVSETDNTLYDLFDNSDNLVQSDISVNNVTHMIENSLVKKYSKLVSMSDNSDILIPMENVVCKIYTLYSKKYREENGVSILEDTTHEDTDNIFVQYDGTRENEYADSTFDTYIWTNEYSTISKPLTFIKSLNHIRTNLYFEDYTIEDKEGNYVHDPMDVRMESVPFIKWSMGFSEKSMAAFMNAFTEQYENINNIISSRLRNETSIDVKLYNTYGRSVNYFIGDESEPLNTVNLRVAFDMWFVVGTDTLSVIPEIKQFIKTKIESIADNGTNQVHISNLIREIERTFTYVDHIRFRGFNNYSSYYQSIKLKQVDIDEMTKEERRKYVPELLVIDLDDITINPYDAT